MCSIFFFSKFCHAKKNVGPPWHLEKMVPPFHPKIFPGSNFEAAEQALDLAHRWQLDHVVEALEMKLVKDVGGSGCGWSPPTILDHDGFSSKSVEDVKIAVDLWCQHSIF